MITAPTAAPTTITKVTTSKTIAVNANSSSISAPMANDTDLIC